MKDLTKSTARLSWALFVYGAQEMAHRARGEDEDVPEAERQLRTEADHLAAETEAKLRSEYKSLFDLGEKVGERMIDLGFELMDPRRAMDRAIGFVDWFSDLARREPEEAEDDAAGPPET